MNTRTLLGALVFITAPVCLQATTSSVPLNYEYDANGNLISGDGKYYEYNDANRLVKVRHYDKTGPVIAEYVYDHTGQRVKKIEDGITTYYIGKHFEAQPDGDKLVNTSYYFANGERVAKKDSIGQLSYYHTNHLGSTSVMTDKEGKLVENNRYYPFGEIREGGKEKYGFTGKEKDRITKIFYFESRYYDSELKHFLKADSIQSNIYDPQSLNRYAYVRNNPLKYIDPTGNEWWKPSTWSLLKNLSKFFGINNQNVATQPAQRQAVPTTQDNSEQGNQDNSHRYVYQQWGQGHKFKSEEGPAIKLKDGSTFYTGGQCTWYAKQVTDFGQNPLGTSKKDKQEYLSDAVSEGRAFRIGQDTIREGNIIVTGEGTYGHVAVVVKDENGNLILAESNYPGNLQVNFRGIPPDSKIYGVYRTQLRELQPNE